MLFAAHNSRRNAAEIINARRTNSGLLASGDGNSHALGIAHDVVRTCSHYSGSQHKWTLSAGNDPQPALTLQGTPFLGDLQLCSWNAQALMAIHPAKRHAKWKMCWDLIHKYDILALQETHTTVANTTRILTPAGGTTIWWSHETQQTGGIGLAITPNFLQHFRRNVDGTWGEWVEVSPGRAAILRLEGARGNLDIATIYLPTGNARRERDAIRDRLARKLRPPGSTLTIIIGDWNFTELRTDRLGYEMAEWSAHPETDEHKGWQNIIFTPFRLAEVWQEEMTHHTSLGTSRLDRAYANYNTTEQLYANWSTTALEWCPQLSTHRPILIRRTADTKPTSAKRTLPAQVTTMDEWPRRVATIHQELLRHEGGTSNPIRNLTLLKRAMAHSATVMAEEQTRHQTRTQKTEELATTDRLKILIAFLRASYQNKVWNIQCLRRDLQRALGCERDPGQVCPAALLTMVKDKTMELAKQNIAEELRALHQDDADDDPDMRERGRQNVMRKLAKLKPGGTTQIQAMKKADGSILTDKKDMAEELISYWAPTFVRQQVDMDDLHRWIQELKAHDSLPTICPDAEAASQWRIRAKDIEWAIKTVKRTTPGPDGIGATHWKHLGPQGVNALLQVARCLESAEAGTLMRQAFEDTDDGSNLFNRGTLCCIPKGDGEPHENGGRIWSAANTRPLSIVDMDNRIIALAFRHRWQRRINAWVSKDQRGFLPKRSMLANIIQMEALALSTAAKYKEGAAILVDFKAAFPSISHDYLHTCLRAVGFPHTALQVVKHLYQDGHCELALGGGTWPGFSMESGIRQGCPLSPMLFAVVMDVLLRALPHRISPDAHHRAFADDIGIIITDITTQLSHLATTLERFGRISGMKVNIKKQS